MFQFSMGNRCNKRQLFDQSRSFRKPDNITIWEMLKQKLLKQKLLDERMYSGFKQKQ